MELKYIRQGAGNVVSKKTKKKLNKELSCGLEILSCSYMVKFGSSACPAESEFVLRSYNIHESMN